MEHAEPKEQAPALQSGLFFVFDVESVGLYGDAFAVGWVVVDAAGQEHDSGLAAIDPIDVDTPGSLIQPGARQWIKQNVSQLPYTGHSSRTLPIYFWDVLQRWWIDSTIETYRNHPKALSFWADWASPVESNFLARTAQQACYANFVEDVLRAVPAPLHEIATLRLAAGMDHSDPFLRVDLPEHNPLADARHSARILVAAMKRLRETTQGGL